MDVSLDLIKTLRGKTGAGIMDCKRSLQEANGDLEKAENILKAAGLSAAIKKSGRVTKEGLVEAYIHSGGRIGVLLELACETDFVARTPEIKQLAHDLAMQVAAMAPIYVGDGDLDPEEPRPQEEVCLMQQTFIKDPNRKVQEIVQEAIAKVGENLRINRFIRFALGE